MKFTAKQMKKISTIFNDYMSIESDKDLKKRKMQLVDYNAFKDVFMDIQRNGKTTTFIENVARYFEKFGFSVMLDEVNYLIEV